ncbi:hypothetical protein NM208_g2157 [Fusarium decemcellulare]|uniref:Uncharacterized protein n=1 Tax=Fusarium decemcellulare TaxID=57161 RepID=A0ACC1STK0_9HYPO|nr:hypothetical protein NM208_g2157 [Fusarium decemcellulare]
MSDPSQDPNIGRQLCEWVQNSLRLHADFPRKQQLALQFLHSVRGINSELSWWSDRLGVQTPFGRRLLSFQLSMSYKIIEFGMVVPNMNMSYGLVHANLACLSLFAATGRLSNTPLNEETCNALVDLRRFIELHGCFNSLWPQLMDYEVGQPSEIGPRVVEKPIPNTYIKTRILGTQSNATGRIAKVLSSGDTDTLMNDRIDNWQKSGCTADAMGVRRYPILVNASPATLM